jgi:hypothetical protein
MSDSSRDGSPVRRLAARLFGFALLCGLCAIGQQESAFAQAGSTGGVIGKTDKSLSSGEGSVEPQKSEPRSKGRPKNRDTSDQPSGVSVTGRWRWSQDCSGHWQGEFNLAETSRGHFNGSFAGTSWHDVGTISEGNVSGTTISFTRKNALVTQYWTGQLAAGRIKGTSTGNATCSWEATRK